MQKINKEAIDKVKEGINEISSIVKKTFGPNGKTIIINSEDQVFTTKDGVTVAKYVHNDDPYINVSIKLLRDISLKTNDEVGDGTTSSIIMAESLFKNGLKAIENKVNVNKLKNEIQIAINNIVTYLRDNTTRIDQNDIDSLYSIAMMSSNQDDELSTVISGGLSEIGSKSHIDILPSYNGNTYFDYNDGLTLDMGVISNHYYTNVNDKNIKINKPHIIVINDVIKDIKIIEKELVNCKERGVVIFCKDIDDKILQTLIYNHHKSIIKNCVIKIPFKFLNQDMFEDFKVICNNITKVITDKEKTILYFNRDSQDVKDRIKFIESLRDVETDTWKISKLNERISNFVSRIGNLFIDSESELEFIERAARAEDAIRAVKTSLEGGIHESSNYTFLKIYNSAIQAGSFLSDGDRVVIESLPSLFRELCNNTGVNYDEVYKEVTDNETGYDFHNQRLVDLKSVGLIDPTNVLISVLTNASSIVATLLTSEGIIVN